MVGWDGDGKRTRDEDGCPKGELVPLVKEGKVKGDAGEAGLANAENGPEADKHGV